MVEEDSPLATINTPLATVENTRQAPQQDKTFDSIVRRNTSLPNVTPHNTSNRASVITRRSSPPTPPESFLTDVEVEVAGSSNTIPGGWVTSDNVTVVRGSGKPYARLFSTDDEFDQEMAKYMEVVENAPTYANL